MITAAFSPEYISRFKEDYHKVIEAGHTHQDGLDAAGVTVCTARAECRKEDKQMLLEMLRKHGTFAQIDVKTTKFLKTAVQHIVQ